MSKRFWMFVPLLAFLGLAIFLYAGIGKDPSVIPSPLIGKPVPAFSLPQLKQQQRLVTREDLLGQPFVLNVWASWCYACRIEHPLWNELNRSGQFPLVGLNWKDPTQDALRWLNQFGDPYQLSIADLEGKFAIDLGVYGAPETFVIDAEGNIAFKHVGPVNETIIRENILPLLQKPEGT